MHLVSIEYYAYCTNTHHVFQSWCVSVCISSYQYAHGAYQYGPTRRQGLHLGERVVQRVRETATRAMVTEGKQQSTSDGIDKGGRWLAREHRQGNHTTTTVGDNERRERAADDDGSDKEGEGGQGNGDGNEGGGQKSGQRQQQEGWHWRQGWRATMRAMAMATRAMATRMTKKAGKKIL
jgi:hypothetical protein